MFKQLYKIEVRDTFSREHYLIDGVYSLKQTQKKMDELRNDFVGDKSMRDTYYLIKVNIFGQRNE